MTILPDPDGLDMLPPIARARAEKQLEEHYAQKYGEIDWPATVGMWLLHTVLAVVIYIPLALQFIGFCLFIIAVPLLAILWVIEQTTGWQSGINW